MRRSRPRSASCAALATSGSAFGCCSERWWSMLLTESVILAGQLANLRLLHLSRRDLLPAGAAQPRRDPAARPSGSGTHPGGSRDARRARVELPGVRRTWSRRRPPWCSWLSGCSASPSRRPSTHCSKYATAAGTGPPAAATFVGRSSRPGRRANVAHGPCRWGQTLGYHADLGEAEFWNTSIDRSSTWNGRRSWVPLGVLPYETTIQPGTGRLLPTWSGAGAAPQYLLVPRVST